MRKLVLSLASAAMLAGFGVTTRPSDVDCVPTLSVAEAVVELGAWAVSPPYVAVML